MFLLLWHIFLRIVLLDPQPTLPLPDLPGDLGELIEGPWGSAPRSTLVPPEGSPTPVHEVTNGEGWKATSSWIADRYDNLMSILGGQDSPHGLEIQTHVHAAVQAQTEGLSGYHNLNADYTATVARQLQGYIHLQNMFFQRRLDVQGAVIAQLEENLGKVPDMVNARVLEGVAAANAHADTAAGNVLNYANQWGVDHIYAPLVDELGALHANSSAYTDAKSLEAVNLAEHAAQDALAPVANLAVSTYAALGPALDALKALQQDAQDCVKPMCDTMGPKTDLGKWLKALNFAATAALLAELAALDGAGIERLLAGLVSLSHGVVNDIDALFTGGETVGQLLTGFGG